MDHFPFFVPHVQVQAHADEDKQLQVATKHANTAVQKN